MVKTVKIPISKLEGATIFVPIYILDDKTGKSWLSELYLPEKMKYVKIEMDKKADTRIYAD